MLNIIIFGPPGSGKGTQSKLIIEKYGLQHISTGEILRNEIAQTTDLGIAAKKLMDNGQLVPDDVVIGMIKNRIHSYADGNGFIFDGFPRTEVQAAALDQLLAEIQNDVTLFISLDVPEDELKKRLQLRGEIEGRSDDNSETIKKRIKEYKDKTAPVADYYMKQSKYVSIEGDATVSEIFQNIQSAIDAKINPTKVR